MAFRELAEMWINSWPDPVSHRTRYLDALDRVREGTIYDKLPYPFHMEFEDTGANNYIELHNRRPSVKFGIAKIVVDQTASLTFGQGHSPYVKIYDPFKSMNSEDANSDDKPTKFLTKLIEFIRHVTVMDAVMFDCIEKGSSGSVCAILKVTKKGQPWVRVVPGKNIKPKFDRDDPNELVSIEEVYQTDYKSLIDAGYTKVELGFKDDAKYVQPNTEFWCNITLDASIEQWMVPMLRADFNKLGKEKEGEPGKVWEWVPDLSRKYAHKWGEVPAVWGRNLHEREAVDGPSTYADIVDMSIEIDYLMSQIGRGFKYSMDPLLAMKAGDVRTTIPVGGSVMPGQADVDRTPAKVIQVPAGGEAKMLEIAGNGLNAAKDWVKLIREWAMETAGGMKSDQEHAGGPQSGRALEILHQALVWLVGRMRLDYGDGMMVPIIKLIIRGIKKDIVKLWGVKPEQVPNEEYPLKLVWPSWWQPRGSDFYQTAQALLLAAGGTSREGKQLMPMRAVFEAFAQAMGHPDPAAVADEAEKEFATYREEQLKILAPTPAGGNTTGAKGA